MAKKQTIKDYYDNRRRDWYYSDLDMVSVNAQYKLNILKLRQAEEARQAKDRPLFVCVLHGSGRHPELSCAHELSNSQLLLERGLELAKKEWNEPVEVETHVLREYVLEPCNACYSTASALCNFPCSCFPGDDISTKLYPSIMKADVLLLSTPVNQAGVASRLDIVLSRLISLDGGYFIPEFPIKDDRFRERAIALSTKKEVFYDPRMFGKVAAYFVTSKDLHNPLEESAPYPRDFRKISYEDTVIGRLALQGAEYGWFHADPFYAVSVSSHDQELSYDKAEFDSLVSDHENAKQTILASFTLASEHVKNPPKLESKGRVNRT
jgi:multimeric flavodoxin WrbA